MPVQVPGDVVDEAGADLSAPLAQLLRDLNLLEAAGDQKVEFTGTPYSLQVIRAGALALNKAWASFAGVAGASGLATAIAGAWQADNTATRVALIAGGSLLASAALIAIALIVRGDVAARARTTQAQLQSRAVLAVAFMDTARPAGSAPAVTGSAGIALLGALALHPAGTEANAGGNTFSLKGIRQLPGETIELKKPDGDWVPISKVEGFKVERP